METPFESSLVNGVKSHDATESRPRAGNDEDAFRVVQDGTLRTTRTFDHKVRSKYLLQIRVFDNGTPPMYSDSYVTVNIIEESKFAPSVAPLDVHIWSYQDDFPGAVIGSVLATDLDPYDRLSYQGWHWLPDGYSQILRSYVFGPLGFKDYGSAPLRCKI